MTDLVRDSTRQTASQGLRSPQARAAMVLVALTLLAVPSSAFLASLGGAGDSSDAAVVTLALALPGSAAILHGLAPGRYPHARLGLCNLLTMARAAGIAVLAGLAVVPEALPGLGWGLVVLATTVLALDAADGWAARRSGLNSGFGARFDVESDVLFAIVMATLAWQAGQVGVWFLLLGALRPLFLLGGILLPWMNAPLPEARWRKIVAALQMILQVALLAPVIGPAVASPLAAGLLTGVALSFAVDVRWLFLHRGANRGGPA